MFGNAWAIAAIARLAGRLELARRYEGKAAELKKLTQDNLWDRSAQLSGTATVAVTGWGPGSALSPTDG